MKKPSFRDLFNDVVFDFIASLDDVPVGIYRTSLEGKLVAANRKLVEIFGFDSLEELTEYRIVDLYRDKKDRSALISVLHEKRFVEDLHLVFYRKDRSTIDVAVTSRGVFDDDGELIFIDGIIRDIAQEKAEAASISRHQKLQGVHEMAGGVGHHLNQPLTILNNLISELLADPQAGDTVRDTAMKIHEQVQKLNGIAKKNSKHQGCRVDGLCRRCSDCGYRQILLT